MIRVQAELCGVNRVDRVLRPVEIVIRGSRGFDQALLDPPVLSKQHVTAELLSKLNQASEYDEWRESDVEVLCNMSGRVAIGGGRRRVRK